MNRTTCNSNQKWNDEKSQCACKKDYSWNINTCICENSKYSKSISDASVIVYDDIISVMDCYGYINFVPTKMTNTIATNVTKKVRDCYILYRVSLAIMLLLIITITCYRYAKQKGIDALTI